ncbi:MAG: hypothetical protein AAF322_14315 [Pseudomonadota bacterium]
MRTAETIILAQIALVVLGGALFALLVDAPGRDMGAIVAGTLAAAVFLAVVRWGVLKRFNAARWAYAGYAALAFYAAISGGLEIVNLLTLLDAVLSLSALFYLFTEWPRPTVRSDEGA